MAKTWRVSIDTSGLEEAGTEEEAIRQFLDGLTPDDCTADLDNNGDDEDEDEDEVEELDDKTS